MSLVSKISGLFTGGLVENIGQVADRFITTDAEKKQFQLQVQELLNQRQAAAEDSLQAELQAKERIIVAEMKQGDTYTKRARPTVVYAGLAIIAFNYCLVPLLQTLGNITVAPFTLPGEFWAAWGGCVGIWTIGRTMEKRGAGNKASRLITGSEHKSLFD